MDDETFDQAIANKPKDREELSDAQWYVACVVVWTNAIEGLDPGQFRFCITPPNPEILEMFDQRIPPMQAAIDLFSVRH